MRCADLNDESVKRNGTTPTWIPQPQDVSVCEMVWNQQAVLEISHEWFAAADATENIYAPLRDA